MITINLQNYRTGKSKIFSGRQKGINARLEKKLDLYDVQEDTVQILLPKDTWTISSSFFGGMFEKSVIALKEEGFRNKYIFLFDDYTALTAALKSNIDEGIYDALNDI